MLSNKGRHGLDNPDAHGAPARRAGPGWREDWVLEGC